MCVLSVCVLCVYVCVLSVCSVCVCLVCVLSVYVCVLCVCLVCVVVRGSWRWAVRFLEKYLKRLNEAHELVLVALGNAQENKQIEAGPYC